MKKALSVAALVVALTGSALAADLPSYKAPPPPPLPPPPLWTGFYVGLNAGGTWSSSNTVRLTNGPIVLDPAGGLVAIGPATAAALGASGVFTTSNNGGFIGGGQIGYNWQFYNSFVAGIEADIQGIASTRSSNTYFTAVPVTAGGFVAGFNAFQGINVSKNLDYIGTVRGRLGWLFTPTLLVYGTGGLAYGGVQSNISVVGAAIPSPIPFTGWFGASSFADTRVGWTAGGGLEWMFWPNWSAKVEYLYYDLGTVSTSFVSVSNSPAGAAFANISQSSARFNGNIVRAGVNYHFNWGAAPIVAKY
ncbi:porin family protein [Methylocystis sp. FS]|uniref:outer membrane protein n=1 Tax=Methylocystis silviterrae TaxID=2743612 RepID=UPI0015814FBA|nr:outer membrane beta-barrel protein [Methylocystis silviterrae]NUJ79137.1 porin family protein [Methylocystis silviterrae]